MSITAKAALITAAEEIRDETAENANTAQRVGTMLLNIINTMMLDVRAVQDLDGNEAVVWGEHIILTGTTGTAPTVVIAATSTSVLQSVVELENAADASVAISINGADSFRDAVPSGGFSLDPGEKCHLEITGSNTVSIVGI